MYCNIPAASLANAAPHEKSRLTSKQIGPHRIGKNNFLELREGNLVAKLVVVSCKDKFSTLT